MLALACTLIETSYVLTEHITKERAKMNKFMIENSISFTRVEIEDESSVHVYFSKGTHEIVISINYAENNRVHVSLFTENDSDVMREVSAVNAFALLAELAQVASDEALRALDESVF